MCERQIVTERQNIFFYAREFLRVDKICLKHVCETYSRFQKFLLTSYMNRSYFIFV